MSSDTQTKIPTTLPAKQAKLMAFIDYYHQQLVDNNIITERDSLDKFSKLFSQDITEQISFCNNFFDYESTHVKSYKEKTKKSKINQKLQEKQNKKNDKLFQKSYNQLKDNKKWNNLLTPNINTILNILPPHYHNQDIRTLHPHTLFPLDPTKPLHTHPLYHILTNKKEDEPEPPYTSSKTDPIPSSTPILKEDTNVDLNELTNVKILQIGETKYLVDDNDNAYDFTSHKYINKVANLNVV